MAIYTLGNSVNQFKGSRGGSTFQRSGTSFAIRQRKKPLFKRTPKTSQSRSVFHNVQSNYRLLDAGQKASWTAQAPNFQRVNSLGETYQLLPAQLFAASNIPLVNRAFPIVESASAPITFPNVNYAIDEFELDPLGLSVIVDSPGVPAGFALEIWFSPILDHVVTRWTEIGLEPVVYDFQSLYKPLVSLLPSFEGPLIVSPAWQGVYGPAPTFANSNASTAFVSMAGVWLSTTTGQRVLDLVDIQDFEL